MTEKKELKNEQLEKVSGGYPSVGRSQLSGELTTSQTYDHQGENLFFYDSRGQSVIYARLDKCWEAYGWFNLWSHTKYDIHILECSSTNTEYWSPGCNQTICSTNYDVYTNYSGPRPIKP